MSVAKWQLGYEDFFDSEFYKSVSDDIKKHSESILQPIKNLVFIDINEIKPNDYNPNRMPKDHLRLLFLSILKNGWTLPVIVKRLKDNKDGFLYEIIDGYHRFFLAKNTLLNTFIGNKIPAVIAKEYESEFDQQCATILHNKARGVHLVRPMQELVQNMLERNVPISQIMKNTGMSKEEVFRLSFKSKQEFIDYVNKDTNGFSTLKDVVR